MSQLMTDEIIDAAIEGFTQQRARIDQKIAELQAMRSGRTAERTTSVSAAGKRSRFSAATRQKMAEAQRRRWAKTKGAVAPGQEASTPAAPKRKRKISKEGLARIVAATKARWERVRAEKAAATKKVAVKKSSPRGAKKAAKKAAVKKAAPAAVAAAETAG